MPAVSRIGDKDNKGDKLVEGSSTVFAGDSSGSPSFSNVTLTLPEEYDVEFATPVIKVAGRHAAFDEPGEINKTPEEYPEDTPPEDDTGEAKEESEKEPEEKPSEDLGDCRAIETPINYSINLTPNFTIGNLTTGTTFPHSIRSQKGLSEAAIVCNLEGLAKAILEPLRKEFGSFRINSGFRVGSGGSQHNRGMAADIQEPSWSNKKHLEVCEWISENLPADQLIIEHGNSVWIHVSYDRNQASQRGELLTMYNGNFSSGLKLYY